MNRIDIYKWPHHNPYCYWLSEIDDDRLETLKREANEANKEEEKKEHPLEKFLKKIPHASYWTDNHIAQANVLFISNEPGLTNIKKLYKNFLNTEKNIKAGQDLSIDSIADSFHKSMLSWLALINHENLGAINGESNISLSQDDLDEPCYFYNRLRKFRLFGKIAYFMQNNEIDNFLHKQLKCIHLDLFPYAQKNGNDANKNNCKGKINSYLENNDKKHCDPCDSFTCDVIESNLSLITKYTNNSIEDKYIFIIGNRVHLYFNNQKKCIRKANYHNKESKGKDNSIIIFKIIKEILSCNSRPEIRILKDWPSGFKNFDIFKVREMDDSGDEIKIEKI